MAKNIEMNVLGSDGQYEVLYPKTTPEQAGSLSINGGTLNGNLYLNVDPTSGMGAATKQYVDNSFGTGDSEIKRWSLVKQGSGSVTSASSSSMTTTTGKINFSGTEINYDYSEFKLIIYLNNVNHVYSDSTFVGLGTERDIFFSSQNVPDGNYKIIYNLSQIGMVRSLAIGFGVLINDPVYFFSLVPYTNILSFPDIILTAQYGTFSVEVYLYGR